MAETKTDPAGFFLNGEQGAVAEQPKVEEPNPAKPAEAAPPQPAAAAPAEPAPKPEKKKDVFDEPKYLAEVSGGKWKSKDDIGNFFTKHSEYEVKIGDLEKVTKEYIKPANEYVKKLNEIALNGGDVNLFQKVNSVEIDKLSPLEKVKIQLQWQKGLTPEQADFKAKRQYLANVELKTITDEMTDEEKNMALQHNENKKAAEIDLAIDAQEAEKVLKGLQVKASTVPDSAKEAEQRNAQRIEQWTPNISKVVAEVGKITKQFKFNDGKDVIDFEYELNADQKKHLEEMLADTVKNVPLGFDDESRKEFRDKIIPNWAASEFREDIMDALAGKIHAYLENKWKERVSGKKQETDAPLNTGQKTDNQRAVEAFFN